MREYRIGRDVFASEFRRIYSGQISDGCRYFDCKNSTYNSKGKISSGSMVAGCAIIHSSQVEIVAHRIDRICIISLVLGTRVA
jgi:hypothetical protein